MCHLFFLFSDGVVSDHCQQREIGNGNNQKKVDGKSAAGFSKRLYDLSVCPQLPARVRFYNMISNFGAQGLFLNNVCHSAISLKMALSNTET